MEKINIAELLKDCPKGMELDCAMFEDLYFDHISDCGGFIYCYINYADHKSSICLDKYGNYVTSDKSKCVIFPKGKTTWEGFVPPCKFKDGDMVFIKSCYEYIAIYKESPCDDLYKYAAISCSFNNMFLSEDYPLCNKLDITNIRFATEEEKTKLFQAIKDNGYKWNTETKTLEKLPKLKEIHFYKDLNDEVVELAKAMNGECEFKDFYRSHNNTMYVIKKENPTIHTYAISALDFSMLLDKGYKIFLHENGKCGELHEGTTELTDKELRKHHDICRIWIGGGFEDFFYK